MSAASPVEKRARRRSSVLVSEKSKRCAARRKKGGRRKTILEAQMIMRRTTLAIEKEESSNSSFKHLIEGTPDIPEPSRKNPDAEAPPIIEDEKTPLSSHAIETCGSGERRVLLPAERVGGVLKSGPLQKRGWDGWTKQDRYFKLTETELSYRKLGEDTWKILSLGLIASVAVSKLPFPAKGVELVVHVGTFGVEPRSNLVGKSTARRRKEREQVELHRSGQRSFATQLIAADKLPLRLRASPGCVNEASLLKSWERAIRRATRKFWQGICCSGFLSKWSVAKRCWEQRFFFLTEHDLCVEHSLGAYVLKVKEKKMPRWNREISRHTRIVRTIALDHVRKTDEIAQGWTSRRDSRGDDPSTSEIDATSHNGEGGVFTITYAQQRSKSIAPRRSATALADTKRATKDAKTRARVVHLTASRAALTKFKHTFGWNMRKALDGSIGGVGGGLVEHTSSSSLFSSSSTALLSSTTTNDPRDVANLSRAELAELVRQTRNAIRLLQRENARLKRDAQATRSDLEASERRVGTLTKMLVGTTVKRKLGSWREHVGVFVTRREKIVREWYNSERLYATSMRAAVERYYVQLLNLVASGAFHKKSGSSLKSSRSQHNNRSFFNLRKDVDADADAVDKERQRRRRRKEERSKASGATTAANEVERSKRVTEDSDELEGEEDDEDEEEEEEEEGEASVDERRIKNIFGNVRDIADFAHSGLASIEAVLREDQYQFSPRQLDAFVSAVLAHLEKETDVLKIYMENYMMHCTSAVVVARRNEAFRSFCESEKTRNAGNLDLESLLVMPVQRLPRRRMLLKDLIKVTGPSHPSRGKLVTAIKRVGKTIASCDDHLNVAKLLQIQRLTCGRLPRRSSSYDGNESDDGRSRHQPRIAIMAPKRRFCQEGCLRKWCARTHWQSRYCYVFSDCLMYSKRHGKPIRSKCDLTGATVTPTSSNVFELHFNTSGGGAKTTKWKADTRIERDQWVGVIREQISGLGVGGGDGRAGISAK